MAISIISRLAAIFKRKSNKPDPAAPVFETQNIKSITLFRLPDVTSGVQVPPEHIAEIAAWLATFTLGEKTKEVVCGANMLTFRIEYSDGTSVTSGTDTITVNGIVYHARKAPQPACINDLLAGNRPCE